MKLSIFGSAALLAAFGGALISTPVFAQANDDPFDVCKGVKIVRASPTLPNLGPEGILGGKSELGHTIFRDGGNNTQPNFVEFTTPQPVTISGIRLFVARDIKSQDRATARFQFFADTNNNGKFGDDNYDITEANPPEYEVNAVAVPMTYSFKTPCTASRFRIEFVGNPGSANAGPRVVELDAIPAAPTTSKNMSFTGEVYRESEGKRIWASFVPPNGPAGRLFPGDQLRITIKHPAGGALKLTVNGAGEGDVGGELLEGVFTGTVSRTLRVSSKPGIRQVVISIVPTDKTFVPQVLIVPVADKRLQKGIGY